MLEVDLDVCFNMARLSRDAEDGRRIGDTRSPGACWGSDLKNRAYANFVSVLLPPKPYYGKATLSIMNHSIGARAKNAIAAWRSGTRHAWVLPALIFLFAFALRAPHTSEGLPYIHYVDEPFVASMALNVLKTGDFNPHLFNYGSLPIYLNVLVDMAHYMYLMGQPPGDHPYMANLDDIRTSAETGYLWEISHPSFYRWNRLLTCTFGAGTTVFVFLLAWALFRNRAVSVVPAVFLAVLPIHIDYSMWVGVDVPSGFFYLGCVYFSLMYARHARTSWLVWALLFVACAAATKYNAALCGVMPVVAMVWRVCQANEKPKPWHWLLLVVIPPITFLIVMPYALLDFDSFAKAVGYEIRHYKVMGHEQYTSEPGFGQFGFQLRTFWANLGTVPVLLAMLGLAGIFLRRGFAFVLLLPALGMAVMSQMLTNFHRNFLVFYPFIALMVLSGLWTLTRMPNLLPEALRNRVRPLAGFVVWGSTTIALFVMTVSATRDAIASTQRIETRTAAITAVNELSDIRRVVIAEELRIHESDLRRLRVPRMMAPLKAIIEAEPDSLDTVFVVPTGVAVTENHEHATAARLSRDYLADIFRDGIVKRWDGANVHLDSYSVNPGVIMCKPAEMATEPAVVAPRFANTAPRSNDPVEHDGQHWQFVAPVGEQVDIPLFLIKRAPYILTFDWTTAHDDGADTTLEVAIVSVSDESEVTKETTEPREIPFLDGDTMNHFELQFSPRAPGRVAVVLRAQSPIPVEPGDPTPAVYVKNMQIRER